MDKYRWSGGGHSSPQSVVDFYRKLGELTGYTCKPVQFSQLERVFINSYEDGMIPFVDERLRNHYKGYVLIRPDGIELADECAIHSDLDLCWIHNFHASVESDFKWCEFKLCQIIAGYLGKPLSIEYYDTYETLYFNDTPYKICDEIDQWPPPNNFLKLAMLFFETHSIKENTKIWLKFKGK